MEKFLFRELAVFYMPWLENKQQFKKKKDK